MYLHAYIFHNFFVLISGVLCILVHLTFDQISVGNQNTCAAVLLLCVQFTRWSQTVWSSTSRNCKLHQTLLSGNILYLLAADNLCTFIYFTLCSQEFAVTDEMWSICLWMNSVLLWSRDKHTAVNYLITFILVKDCKDNYNVLYQWHYKKIWKKTSQTWYIFPVILVLFYSFPTNSMCMRLLYFIL